MTDAYEDGVRFEMDFWYCNVTRQDGRWGLEDFDRHLERWVDRAMNAHREFSTKRAVIG